MARFGVIPGLLVAALAAGCGHNEPRQHAADERLPRVETVTPAVTVLPVRIELTATVEPFEKAELCARVPGVVAQFFPPDLDIGTEVKAGDKLVELSIPDLVAERKNKEALLEQSRKQKVQAQE